MLKLIKETPLSLMRVDKNGQCEITPKGNYSLLLISTYDRISLRVHGRVDGKHNRSPK
jgi:hypothetical protein